MAGAGFKTFATGEVLTASDVNTYLMQQTVMVFADSAARSTALGATLAEGMLSYLKDTNSTEVYNGSAWVAVGNTGDITSVTAGYGLAGGGTSGDVTLTTAGGVSGTNPVLNSNFSVWQRGTTFSNPTSTSTAYGADRWSFWRPSGWTTGITMSRQTTSDTTNLPNIQYCARIQRTAANSSTLALYLAQNFESVNSIPFAGKSYTMSFYARKGADYSATGSGLIASVSYGTGTDQNIISGLTGETATGTTTVTLTTTWQRFSITGTIAATATQIVPVFNFTPTGTAGTNDYYEITGIQIEIGSAATAYQPNGKTYAAEFAACQRYYQVPGLVGHVAYSATGVMGYLFPVTMRTTPTASFSYSGVANRFYNIDTGATSDLVSPTVIVSSTSVNSLYAFTPASWAVAKGTGLNTNWTLSAEL